MKEAAAPLEAFSRRMWRIVESIFEDDGEVPMTWLLERPGREQTLVITPVTNSPSNKDSIEVGMRKLMRDEGIIRYAVAMECWVAPTGNPVAPSQHPERREGMMVVVEDGRERLATARHIVRPQHRKPYLDKIEPMNSAVGRFMNLLDAVVMN